MRFNVHIPDYVALVMLLATGFTRDLGMLLQDWVKIKFQE